MSNLSKIFRGGLCFAALATASVPAAALAAPGAKPDARNCFYSTQWRGWKSPNPSVIYIGVNNRDVYRADLAGGSRRLMSSDHLISEVRGSNLICSAIDLDLKVSDSSGFATPLFVKSLVKLTPDEVAAIPPRYRP